MPLDFQAQLPIWRQSTWLTRSAIESTFLAAGYSPEVVANGFEEKVSRVRLRAALRALPDESADSLAWLFARLDAKLKPHIVAQAIKARGVYGAPASTIVHRVLTRSISLDDLKRNAARKPARGPVERLLNRLFGQFPNVPDEFRVFARRTVQQTLDSIEENLRRQEEVRAQRMRARAEAFAQAQAQEARRRLVVQMPTMGIAQACQVLGLPTPIAGQRVDPDLLRQQKRVLARQHHPDVTGNAASAVQFDQVMKAADVVESYNRSINP